MNHKIQISLFLSAFVLLLAACTGQSEEISTDQLDDSSAIAAAVEEEAGENSANANAQTTTTPVVTLESTFIPETTLAPPPTHEPTDDLQDPSIVGFGNYEAEAFGIQLAHPESWLVTEEPELGLKLESAEGYLSTMPDAEGAGMIIYPRDELAGEDIVEALRLSVFSFGPPPSIFIEFPTVSTIGEHDIATAAFDERDSGMEGFYAFIQNGEHGVFVFAATTGIVKADFLDTLEDVIGTVILGDVINTPNT